MTVRQLLTHTAGFSYGFDSDDPVDRLYNDVGPFGADDLDGFIGRLATLPLRFEPGAKWHYSVCFGRGRRGCRADQRPVARCVSCANGCFGPLDMRGHVSSPFRRTSCRGCCPTMSGMARRARWPCTTRGNWGKRPATLYSGGGGLVSTARDYMRFAEMLRNGGVLHGVRILLPENRRSHGDQPVARCAVPPWLRVNARPRSTRMRPASVFGLGFGLVTALGEEGVGFGGRILLGWRRRHGFSGSIRSRRSSSSAWCSSWRRPWPLREKLKALTYEALAEREERE